MSEYKQVSIETAGQELDRLHAEIMGSMRKTVDDAVRAGEILFTVKERVGHGSFIAWISKNCSFTEKTAERYMKLKTYQSKIDSVTNLQDAYKQIETLEAREKQTEENEARKRVNHYLETGERLDGWRRGTDDKQAQELKASRERFAAFQEALEKKESEKKQESADTDRIFQQAFDTISNITAGITAKALERHSFKERIRVSADGKDDAFVDALMDYLDELDSDSRRIETCYNIIKVCKGIAVDLQRGIK